MIEKSCNRRVVDHFLNPVRHVWSSPVAARYAGDRRRQSHGRRRRRRFRRGGPARLLAMLQDDHPGSTLSSRAISGDTTQDLINKQLDAAVADLKGAPEGNWKLALVCSGSNDLFGLYAGDTCTEWYPDLEICEREELGMAHDNLNTILAALEATGAELFIALLDDQTKRPVIANFALRNATFPGITDEEVPRMSDQIEIYNGWAQTHGATHGASLV